MYFRIKEPAVEMIIIILKPGPENIASHGVYESFKFGLFIIQKTLPGLLCIT